MRLLEVRVELSLLTWCTEVSGLSPLSYVRPVSRRHARVSCPPTGTKVYGINPDLLTSCPTMSRGIIGAHGGFHFATLLSRGNLPRTHGWSLSQLVVCFGSSSTFLFPPWSLPPGSAVDPANAFDAAIIHDPVCGFYTWCCPSSCSSEPQQMDGQVTRRWALDRGLAPWSDAFLAEAVSSPSVCRAYCHLTCLAVIFSKTADSAVTLDVQARVWQSAGE